MDSISAIPQQPQLGRLAQFLRYLETQNAPEFLPKQLDVMGLVRQLALPQASTVENLSYGNLPFTMPPEGTGAMIPQVKTGRKAEVADLISTFSGLPPGVKAVSDVGTKISNEAADSLVRMITRNPQATAPGVIQETSMPFMQAVAPRPPGLLAPRSELGFYSALEEAVGPLQNKGTGTQFLAQLEKTPGVKPEEIKWTGLDDFLKSKPNVTKAEVQDYLAQNRVNLQEVRLGDTPFSAQAFNERFSRNGIGYTMEQTPNGPVFYLNGRQIDYSMVPEQMQATLENNVVSNTKFSSYTLPGGENYREILLTLPNDKKIPLKEQYFIYDQNNQLIRQGYGQPTQRTEIALRANPQWRLETQMIPDPNAKVEGLFRSSHFDQPNILAHMRVNDRVVDGKKTLFIEEVQSDWHQAGRKKGYQSELTPAEREEMQALMQRELRENNFGGADAVRLQELLQKPYTGVPDAPFKTTWHELTLKRAIQEAAEKGYDKIAFTTGKTQAERYDLSKQVDELLYKKNPDGTYRLSAQVRGRGQSFGDSIPESKLEEYVGKEVAKSITQGSGKDVNLGGPGSFTQPRDDWKSMSGLDLKIGGEGMEGFYDQILPKSLEKLGKKFDARVGKTDMDGVEVWSMDITPKMRESVLTKGQPLFQAAPLIPAAGLLGDEEQ